MDKLQQALNDDAAKIRAEVSPELDQRIQASLTGISPERPARRPARRPLLPWWASSLTGVAAAIGVIVLVNSGVFAPAPPAPDSAVANVNGTLPTSPVVPELTARAAVLAGPLEQELENLEADIRKAGQAVRADIGFDL